MMKLLTLLAALCVTSPLLAASCPQPGEVRLPLSEALQTVAIRLEFNMDANGRIDLDAPMDKRVLPQLSSKPAPARDASLLALLKWHSAGTLPVFRITMHDAAPLFDTYLGALDRHALTAAADALREARAAFPAWNVPVKARYAQWSDGRGTKYPAIDAKLRAASDKFSAAMPAIEAKTEELARQDPAFFKDLQALLDMTPDEARFSYLAYQVEACLQAAGGVSALPPVLQHALYVHRFITEAGNGSAHQYFYNSTGGDAAQFQASLRALNLRQQADDIAAAMALLGAPYPTDTQARRAVIATFSEAQDEALAQPTWIMDTPALYEAMDAALKQSGYWPQ